jgi:hypothetical protein
MNSLHNIRYTFISGFIIPNGIGCGYFMFENISLISHGGYYMVDFQTVLTLLNNLEKLIS